ncbi:hypothetical protein COU97_01185 [Candidatus Shapirobacteria bacterium CG10_big_fil_rev_8_21_14_0_10_48_15]|uniref:Radical SAM core domain-containing protein n=1 Tax=Candidatus Shapirobacteria bacterium CG10_big_fil_rev_8_21_14_0_10_48_15 TaxID=1974484 RepID=A0A2M8L7E2_9BACT|nr:MAG: hypothetical protein COU97_01185 [Candidatus Shapirobacteria bacterium CG10_big_fil_rev_8_21_14_0_10_48_15]
MKIHFLIPPADSNGQKVFDRIFGCNYGFFTHHNVLFLSAATLLQQQGYEVVVSDCFVEKISLDQALARGGDIFVFYSVFLSRALDLKAAAQIRSRRRNVPVIFLGSDPNYYSDKYLTRKNYFLVRAEPEYSLLELVQKLSKKARDFSSVKGISWVKNNQVVHNPSRSFIDHLNQLPIPNRLLYRKPLAYPNARFGQFPSTTALFSRGCAYRCYYCFPNTLSYTRELDYKRRHRCKPPVRVRSAAKVIAEMKLIASQGFRSVSILDDQFLWDRKRTDQILAGIKDLGLEISILARCDRITDFKLAKAMRRAGIKHIAFGVESFDQPILDYIKKDLDVKTIEKGISFCQKAGIEPEVNILIGSCPLETKKTIRETLSRVAALKINIVHINVCTPFPGTEFARIAKAKGWMTVPEYVPIDSSAQSLIAYPHLSDKQLVRAVKGFVLKHYFNPVYLFKRIRELRSARDLLAKIKAGLNEFNLLLIGK